ncbi:hypothetical protein EV424DRAFT_1544890 [Suillus variegatus]|nr:hypothetical protein EV424DRAFT_1544890 [Suillus variegatus]
MSGSTQSKETSILRCLVLKYGPKRVLVKREKSYNLMFASACRVFPSISRDILTFQTNQLDVCDGHYVEITAEVWSDIVDLLHVVEVTQRVKMSLPVPLPLDDWAISLPDNQSASGQVDDQDSSLEHYPNPVRAGAGSYWLPSILKHEYVALRFVPQAAFERAASLHISPQPDVVTRIFMLFKGIREDLANWTNARIQAEKDVAWWVNVIGVDPARAGDVTLFRVLEWGGMEVLI